MDFLRRLNIACGIAHEPDIIIFDEPTVAVDPQSRNNILEGIKKLNKNGATIIYTSHYMDEVEELCDYIVIIDRGKVIAEGSSDSLKAMIDTKEKISFRSENLDNEIIEKIKSIDSLLEMDFRNDTYHLSFANGKDNLIKLINILNENSINYDSLTSQSPSLNDVFLSLTGKGLRD